MKVWITKYALTQGVKVVEVRGYGDPATMISLSDGPFTIYYHKPDWHTTREEAIARVAVMVEKKIKSLRKQLKKLETFQIEVP